MKDHSTAAGVHGGDMFLHVQAKRAGKIKGEAHQTGHVDDIIVQSWHWGMHQSSALGSTQALSRRSFDALTIIKGIDQSSTGLMAALCTNDEIKEARLSMRKSGGGQEEYFVITLARARISRLNHEARPDGSTQETVEITFNKVDVEYRPQKTSGSRGGATSFSDEFEEGS